MTALIGIDFGTATSSVAVMQDGSPHVITTRDGMRVPSVVAFNPNGNLLLGQAAKRQIALNPENSFFSLKRLLGRNYDDPEIQAARRRLPFEMKAGPDRGVRVVATTTGREFSPEELAAAILKRLKEEAEAYLGHSVTEAVLTVPAYFNENQRQALKRAAGIAGLQTRRIIDEPTATALAYGAQKPFQETVLVVDLGGGTYDVSLVTIDGGSVDVQANHGDTYLGGEDWDTAIAGWIVDEFQRRHGIDLSRTPSALQRILQAAEEAKFELTTETEASIHLPFISSHAHGPLHLDLTLTRSRFRDLTQHLAGRLEDPIRETLEEAGVDGASLDAIILVGGASRMPCVGQALRNVIGREPALDVDPDQTVTLGAAWQAGLLAGKVKEIQSQDLLPLSVGLETMGGLMAPLIPRNSPLPARHTEIFSTTEDNQTEVEIHVLQGERQMAADNTTLGLLKLEDIPAAPRGVPQIEVTFQVDADGMLRVNAREATSGASQALSVAIDGTLSEGDVTRLVEEAEQHAAQDLHERKLAEARNVARQTIYQTRRSLEYLNGHFESQICRQKRAHLKGRLADLEAAIREADAAHIRHLTSEIQEAGLILDQLIYDKARSDRGERLPPHSSEEEQREEHLKITIETL